MSWFNVTWLIEFSIKATLLLGAARIAAFLLRRAPADVRHRLWLAALFGVTILALPVRFPQPVSIAVPVQFSVTAMGGALPARIGTGAWSLWSAIWIAGIIVVLARLLAGVVTIARWTRRARRVNRVLVSDSAPTPLTWGLFRPVILFPACASEWPDAQLELALRHEQAHVARRDWLWQMLANAVNAVFWFHPLVWLANAELRREAESAADDLVLASGVDAADYAEQLVRVARFLSGTLPLAPVPSLPLAAVPMARSRILESRVRQILDSRRRCGQASLVTRTAVAVLACACLVPLLALQEESALRAVRIAAVPAAPAPPQLSEPAAAAQPAAHAIGPPQDTVNPPSVAAKPVPVSASTPGVTIPRVLYRPEPQYTEEARLAKIQGSVKLSLVVDEQGRPQDIKVATSLDPGLDQQAIDAVGQWQFAPATKDGAPIPVTAFIEVTFRLL
jgi:TonB family protein